MNKRTDDRIAREICGWEKGRYDRLPYNEPDLPYPKYFYWRNKGESIPVHLGDEYSPSANITNAIEALENLSSEMDWKLGRTILDDGSIIYDCSICWGNSAGRIKYVRKEGRSCCAVICDAVLDERTLAAVRKARKVDNE